MSIEIQPQPDYDVNFELLLEQYKESGKLKSIISVFNSEIVNVEKCYSEIRDNYFIDSAEGEQLDKIGLIFSEQRLGRSDTDYRVAIKAKAASMFSGTPEDIYTQLRLVYGATSATYSPPEYGAGEHGLFYMNCDVGITEDQIYRICPAGIGVLLGRLLALENGDLLVFENGDSILTTYIV